MVLCASDALAPVTMAEGGAADPGFGQGQGRGFPGSPPARRHGVGAGARGDAGSNRDDRRPEADGPACAWPSRCRWRRANALWSGPTSPAQDQSGLTTIGGGRILGVSNVRLRRKKPWTLSSLAARRDALDDPERWCELMLRESAAPLTAARAAAEVPAAARGNGGGARTTRAARAASCRRRAARWLHRDVVEETAGQDAGGGPGLPHREPAARRAGPRRVVRRWSGGNPEVCDLAAESLVNAQAARTRRARVFARAGWSARVSGPRPAACATRSAAAFQRAGWAGPAAAELAATLGEPLARVEKMIQLAGRTRGPGAAG